MIKGFSGIDIQKKVDNKLEEIGKGLANLIKQTNPNKLQKLEKHRAWAKRHRAERQAEFQARGGERVRAKKSLGQNFLHDVRVVEGICNNVEIDGKVVVEIGPGTGFLTQEILLHKPKKLILIEKDNELFAKLNKKFQGEIDSGLMEIFNDDAMKFDAKTLFDRFGEKITIIANLPYNIGTTLVMNWMGQLDFVENIVVMLQKEVVERIVAVPQTHDYGRISVLIQTMCDCKKLFDVKPECFHPQPKVVSSVVKITPKAMRIDKEKYDLLDEFCKVAFSQRRKKLANTLKKSKFLDTLPQEFLTKRPEEISVKEFIKLTSDI